MTEMPMHVPHLSMWSGGMAGLRVDDTMKAIVAACVYRPVLVRMCRRGFQAAGTDVMGGGIALLALAIMTQALFGLTLIFTKGRVPADEEFWSRTMVGISYLLSDVGFTVVFAGLTTRSWLGNGCAERDAARHGRQMYFRLAGLAAVWIGFGVFVAWRS